MAKEIKNISASVKERLLFRLSISPFVNNFILKGALLFLAHDISRLRPTRDIDFLGSCISNNKNEILEIVKQILRIDFEDGLRFDSNQIESEDIVEDEEYQGVRIKCFAFLENARERVQIDIGFGDRITAGPIEIEFPTLLDFPAPQIKVYSIESAVAEKLEAIVSLQLQTSRMKDFYDILFFAGNYHFKKDLLKEAIQTTFNHRETDIQLRTAIFEDKFKTDDKLQKYWSAFLSRNKLTAETNFTTVVDRINSFIEPIFKEKTKNNWDTTS